MTGLMGKVKDALNPSSHSSQPEGTHGHHSTRTANAADPRVDSDRDHRAAPATGAHDGSYTASDNYTYGSNNRGVDGPATRTDGPHNSNLMNKADPRVDSDRDHSRNVGMNPSGTATTGSHNTTGTSGLHSGTTGTTGLHSGTTGTTSTAGPHNSNLMNKADPRVDSDRDHSRNMGMNPSGTATTGSYGTTGAGTTGLHSTTGTTGVHTGAHTGTTGTTSTAGPHNSNLLNKADPRVDSDRDGSRNMGMNSSGTATTGSYGTAGTHTGATGFGSSTTHGATGTAGPHNSNLMNKADPRVDSDRDHSRNMGMNPSGTATTGTTGIGSSTHGTHGAPEGTYGTHNSRVANAADPRIDSDRDNRGATGTAGGKSAIGGFGTGSTAHGTSTTGHTTGASGLTGSTGTHATGPAPNTAGPHKSDMMNKIDPRVDSDLDGSKTYGGDKTYSRS